MILVFILSLLSAVTRITGGLGGFFINTSSPDRGLKVLVELFKRVKEVVPQARLQWAYGWGIWDVVHGDNLKMIEWKAELIKEMNQG